MAIPTIKKKLGEILIDAGLIDGGQLQEALERQRVSHKKLGRVLVDMNLLGELEICQALSDQLAIPMADLDAIGIGESGVLAEVPRLLAFKHNVLPVSFDEKALTVVISDPLNFDAIRDLEFFSGKDVRLLLAPESRLLGAVEHAYQAGADAEKAMGGVILSETIEVVPEASGDELDESKLVDGADAAPVVRLVSVMVADAVTSRASDIHLEPKEKETAVRYRIDGEMRTIMTIPANLHQSVVSRIKVMSNMDISERRKPMDSRTKVRVAGRVVDLRVSTLPSLYGERLVMRILDPAKSLVPLDDLGFTPLWLKTFRGLLDNPQGCILITGPTGSGKTTLLYSALNEIKSDARNIITLEDPVEYRLAGINQVQVNEKVGMTFAAGLRSILRQDPDVVMVGEIRDQETSEIAFRAAQTGHLVLATLHTNNAPATLSRLYDLGLAPYLVASSLLGIVAQRLVRCICPDCREKVRPDPVRLESLGLPAVAHLFTGAGCKACNYTGYRGRMAVFEVLAVDTELRQALGEKVGESAVEALMRRKGIARMFDDGWEKVRSGLTTLDELLARVPRPSDTSPAAVEPLTPVEVPAGLAASPPEPGPASSDEPEEVRLPRLVLVGEPAVTEPLAEAMRVAGYLCDAVGSGIEALRLLALGPCDLVAVESSLPCGAFNLIRELRGHLATSRVPVILLGALPPGQTAVEAYKLGVSDIVEGDLTPESVLALVERILPEPIRPRDG